MIYDNCRSIVSSILLSFDYSLVWIDNVCRYNDFWVFRKTNTCLNPPPASCVIIRTVYAFTYSRFSPKRVLHQLANRRCQWFDHTLHTHRSYSPSVPSTARNPRKISSPLSKSCFYGENLMRSGLYGKKQLCPLASPIYKLMRY